MNLSKTFTYSMNLMKKPIFNIIPVGLCVLAITGCKLLQSTGQSKNTNLITTGINDIYAAADVNIELPDAGEIRNLNFQRPDKDGNFDILPGFSEFTVKSYCINAGSPRPGKGNGYGIAPLTGEYADILKSIVSNASSQSDIWQQDVQHLIWAILAKSNINDLHPNLKALVRKLLTPSQIKQIQKNALKVYSKTLVGKMVEKMPYEIRKAFEFQNEMREKFTNAQASFEEIEAMAAPEAIKDPPGITIKKGDWFKHPDGYYIRVLPDGYQKMTIQYYNPDSETEGCNDPKISFGRKTESCTKKSNPASQVAVPANSNSQGLIASKNNADSPSGAPPDSTAGLPEEVVKQLSAAGIEEIYSQPDLLSETKKTPAQTVEGNIFERRVTDLLLAKDNALLQKFSSATGLSVEELKSYKIAYEVKTQLHNCGYFLADQLLYKDSVINGETKVFGIVNECKLSSKTKLTKNQNHFKLNMETKQQYKILSTNGATDLSTGDFTGIEIRFFLKSSSTGKSNGAITVTKIKP
jgi:hypothetical protein